MTVATSLRQSQFRPAHALAVQQEALCAYLVPRSTPCCISNLLGTLCHVMLWFTYLTAQSSSFAGKALCLSLHALLSLRQRHRDRFLHGGGRFGERCMIVLEPHAQRCRLLAEVETGQTRDASHSAITCSAPRWPSGSVTLACRPRPMRRRPKYRRYRRAGRMHTVQVK